VKAQTFHGVIALGEEFYEVIELLLIEKECDGIWVWDFT
jgi:hypothetical protein